MRPLSPSAMVEVNDFVVLDYIRRHASTTRPEIAHALELSQATVSRIVARLLASDIVRESGIAEKTVGRPRTVLTYNGLAGSVLGIDLGGTKCHGAIADLSGEILFECVRPTHESIEPYNALLAVIETLRTEAARRGLPVRGLAVGVPAVIDPESGLAVEGPNVQWEGFDLIARLHADVDIPFAVENDVNLATLALAWRGDVRGVVDFVTISIGTGIGAGIIIGGRLIKGSHNAAGEIGYLAVDPRQLAESAHGGLGGLERVASGVAIAARARALLEAAGEPSLLTDGEITSEAVFAAALSRDAIACRVLDEVLDHVAQAIIAVASVVDPARVVLDGGVGRALEPYLEPLADRVARQLRRPPMLSVSRLGPNGTVVGAIAAALDLVTETRAPSHLRGALAGEGLMRHG